MVQSGNDTTDGGTVCRCDWLLHKVTGQIIGRQWSQRCPDASHAPGVSVERVDEYGTMQLKFKSGLRLVVN